MNRNRRLIPLCLLLVPLVAGLSSCESFDRVAYRSLKVAKAEYEVLQAHAARSFVRGRLSEQQWERFALAGNRFIVAHTTAADLMQSYQRVKRAGEVEQQRRLERRIATLLGELPVLLVDLRRLLEIFEPSQTPPAPEPSKK